MTKLKRRKKDEPLPPILTFNDEADDLLNVSTAIAYINLHDRVGYPTECSSIWKHCLCKTQKFLKQNVQISWKETQSIKQSIIFLNEFQDKRKVRSCRSTGAMPVQASSDER